MRQSQLLVTFGGKEKFAFVGDLIPGVCRGVIVLELDLILTENNSFLKNKSFALSPCMLAV